MIINSAPQNEAIVSNVGEIGEFRIRNSAKAFNILSSGLYANKIRAIIRELSCNAVDSHTAAGKQNTPFDVHLPNALEPHFSIRDYGTGLTHDQVTNIYTTYFESTKTNSNDYIGALGLGSKSPFSYTDNFTVTAIKDGRKGIYTAFINEQGVPSIALMMEEQTTEPSGVEVKFSVNDRYDFEKFRQEARNVFEFFKLRPVVSGNKDFAFRDTEYMDKDIIPGVHYRKDCSHSLALMGNIAYPIQVPDADTSLGKLRTMLSCGLVMEFNIGELDFQASREGLSYIPQTIESIKNKLEQLNVRLAEHIAEEANQIENLWERAFYLRERMNARLYSAAVEKYITDTNFDMVNGNSWHNSKKFKFTETELQKDYNMVIRSFTKSVYHDPCVNNKPSREYSDQRNTSGHYDTWSVWEIPVTENLRFVINDTKLGATERAKYHYRKNKEKFNITAFVIEPFDRTKPVKTTEFFTAIKNPPESYKVLASSLDEKERKTGSLGTNVTIMHLEKRGSGGYYRQDEVVWRDAGKAASFDTSKTHYYMPLSGFQALGKFTDLKLLNRLLSESELYKGEIYGVRKGDIEFIKTQKNWVNIETHIVQLLNNVSQTNVLGMVKQALDLEDILKYNVTSLVNIDSPYRKIVETFIDVAPVSPKKQTALASLCRAYDVKQTVTSPQSLIDQYTKEVEAVHKRYPLIDHISGYGVERSAIAEYINLIDKSKGI